MESTMYKKVQLVFLFVGLFCALTCEKIQLVLMLAPLLNKRVPVISRNCPGSLSKSRWRRKDVEMTGSPLSWSSQRCDELNDRKGKERVYR